MPGSVLDMHRNAQNRQKSLPSIKLIFSFFTVQTVNKKKGRSTLEGYMWCIDQQREEGCSSFTQPVGGTMPLKMCLLKQAPERQRRHVTMWGNGSQQQKHCVGWRETVPIGTPEQRQVIKNGHCRERTGKGQETEQTGSRESTYRTSSVYSK